MFAERGFVAATMEEIAERAQVSKPLVYQHFGGKQGLYSVVVDQEMDQIVTEITLAISSGTSRERAERAAVAFLSYVKDSPAGFAVLSHDAPAGRGKNSMSSVMSEVAERVGVVLKQTFKETGYDPENVPIYAHALVGMVSFVAQWWMETRTPSVEVVASHVVSLAWVGLHKLPRHPKPIEVSGKQDGPG